MFYTYGSNIDAIINKAYDLFNTSKNKALVLLEAEIWYVVFFESVINIDDFLTRRTGRTYFSSKESLENIENIAFLMSKYLKWTEAETKNQVSRYKEIAKKNHL